MISHFFIREYLSFDEAQLFFQKGLVVFTGPSGSGKSILLNALLGTMAQSQSEASMAEVALEMRIDLEEFGIESDERTLFKQLKKGNTRYFVNNQSITRKSMQEASSQFVRYLSHKDMSDFDKERLLEMVDAFVMRRDGSYGRALEHFAQLFANYTTQKRSLQKLLEEEKRLEELREFAAFEVAKIDAISPQIGEDETLETIKKSLSKKEKIEEKIAKAQVVFEAEHAVSQALEALEVESAFFDDAMNELRSRFESAQSMLEELEEVDVEAVLDRIQAIGELKRRYGSIEAALAHRDTKAKELEKYENFESEKKRLTHEVAQLLEALQEESDAIHVARLGVLPQLQEVLNSYLQALYLREAQLELAIDTMDKSGVDALAITLKNSTLEQLSSGEFNRLRLALMAVRSDLFVGQGGVLILDEIDANLSGEESMSVARVLTQLAQTYQIFAISHQPQLTSQAHQHFLVYKEGDNSYVKPLDEQARIDEIARMISGDVITQEARDFATKLRGA
ncbi:MAG: hypothetical protein KU37_09750 [Sulfuricurvum sp. PC08-66]|nr:MAG: hypothetical protein KU37_09750 [Sulfuricurvum sp. PC08-66]